MKALQTSKLIKLIIALAVCFVGVVFANQVNAATEDVVDSNNYTVTWEYEVEGGKAVNARITKVIDPQSREIIPREPENELSQYPEIGSLTPPLYRHTYWKIEVPSTLGGRDVISVGDGHTRIINAYDGPVDSYDATVTKVVLPSSIQRINDHAFENVLNIDTINFPNSIKYIGVKAFRNSLLNYGYYAQEFRVPHSLEEIGESAFEIDCNVPRFYGIKNLVIDENPSTLENYTNLKKIGKRAFARQHIKSIRIPSTVEEVGEDAFWGCKYVDELIIEASNHQLLLKDGAFSNMEKLGATTPVIDLPSNVVLGTGVFAGDSSASVINIPANITELPDGTFSGCTRLNANTTQFTKIGNSAYAGCQAIRNDNYNNLVQNATVIGDYAFSGCQGLTGEIVVKDIVTSLGGAFVDCDNITSVRIDANLTKIPDRLCANCDKLTTVVKPNSVTEIGAHSFESCPQITMEEVNTNLLNNITKIGEGAFANNPQLSTELVLPNTVTELGDKAFYNCTGIENIVFSNSLTTIGAGAFAKIDTLPEVMRFPASVTKIGTNAFENVREAFFGANAVDLAYHWNGLNDVDNSVVVHFGDCTHKVELINSFDGITVKNTATNANFETGDYACQSNLNLQVENTDAYPELVARIRRENKYAGNAYEDEFINLKENNNIVINDITRDVQIRIQKTENDTDLVVREFISKVNGEEPAVRRIPNISTTRKIDNLDPIEYKHTKQPITVDKYDVLTYTIRVYNEDNKPGTVKKLNVYLQDGLELDTSNTNSNSLYNWQVEQTTEQGTIISTDYLKTKPITAYRGEGKPQFEELEITCKVTKDDSQNLTCIAELADSYDTDAIGGNITLAELPDYKLAESRTSHDESFIQSAEDDTDYELVTLKNYVKVGYTIAIQKIDEVNFELLNGAKFNLYDKDENLIESKVTVQDGSLVFDEIISYGLGTDIYYIEEAETPAGYEKTFDGKIILTVQKNSATSLVVTYEVNEKIETNVDGRTIIPISTAEELSHVGNNQVYTINGVDLVFSGTAYYQLQNDIDLSGIESWEPLNVYDSHFVLDGNNHKITGLKITNQTSSNKNAVGLFGILAGTVKDLELSNINLSFDTMSSTTPTTGPNYGVKTAVGGIAGFCITGVFDNVKVDGLITVANFENVGGFIGHTYDGQAIKMKDCSFNGTIEADENVGGLIGCAKTTIDLISCTAEGNITAGSDNSGLRGNAGGLVGVITKPGGASTDNVMVKYSQADARIDVILRNKKTRNGNYKISLFKIDRSNPDDVKALDGAKFTVYNENLQPIEGLENVTVRDNGLQIADVVVDTLKSDVFYIKETEAPEGYDILVKDYVKIVVTKKWNTEKLRYEVDLVPSVTSGKTETPDDSIATMSGVIFEPEQSYIVAGKASRIRASNCVNKANVVSNNTAGGIVGIAVSNVNMYDCSNIGKVQARASVGGIAGQLGHSNRNETAKIIRCTNGVKGDEENEYVKLVNAAEANIGGIIGFTSQYTTIDNCENYAKIEGNADHMAGVVALARNTVIDIYDSTNYGTIINNKNGITCTAGGIIGGYIERSLDYYILGETPPVKYSSVCYIDNCTTKENVAGYGRVGGILGHTSTAGEMGQTNTTTTLTIKNCKVESDSEDNIITITSNVPGDCGSMGVICGGADCEVVNISNNELKNVKIIQEKSENDTQHHVGGILGTYYAYDKHGKTTNVTIQDNIVDNLKLEAYTGGNIGGIVGMLDVETTNHNSASLSNNVVKNSQLKLERSDETLTNQGIAGILGNMYYGDNVYITNCKVIDTDIINNSNARTAGIAGFLKANNTIQIVNCEIKSTGETRHKIQANVPKIEEDIYRYNVYTQQQEYVRTEIKGNEHAILGGIVAVIWDDDTNESYIGKNHNIRINNCRIENQDLEASYEYGGSPVGGVIGVKMNALNSTININKIEFNNVKIKNNSTSEGTSSDKVLGGIIAEIENDKDVYISNINYNNVEIEGSNVVLGGILGNIKNFQHNLILNSIKIDGLKIDNDVKTNAVAIGGIVGACGTKSVAINNSNIEDLDINVTGNSVSSIGGLIGWKSKMADIRNNKINNLSINYTETSTHYTFSTGGIVGASSNYSSPTTTNFADNTISNLSIKTQNGSVGGIFGNLRETVNITGNTIKNIKLEIENRGLEYLVNNDPTRYGNAFGGIIGLFGGDDNTSQVNIENNDIKNMEFIITGDSIKTHVGGILGFIKNFATANINNTTIDGLKINNESTEGIIGGIVGLVNDGQKVAITNSQVNNFQADGNYALGGILGCGSADINNATVTDMDTSFDGDNVAENKNTVVGGIAGIATEQSTISNATVTNTEATTGEPAKVIKSNYLAGGIAGICSGIIKDSKVENVTVESTAEVPELPEEDIDAPADPSQGTPEEAAIVDGNIYNKALAVAAQYLQEFTNVIVRNVTVVNGANSVVVNE